MTWNRVALLAVLGALAGAPAAARADVLEIGPAGAQWIVGGQQPVSETPALNLDEAPAIPEAVVADVSNNAANVPTTYAAKVKELSARFDLSPALIEALVWQESRWRADARSPVGARGLAQLMPGTARDLGVNPDDPFANLEGGARYLREQLDRFDGDVEKALAAYNAGPGRVLRAGGIPRIRETQTYVAAIMGRLSAHSRR
ncbi:transglycosylase SLT domain-containing protein [Altererythrobacter soli]|uniref:Transglycosylase SLT domain-containing protein n=1 Tax=Croceibacterium soli TaxID=1739690 RepID=A0A6I4URR4_9SPHN|nr:lytic transglycosylase domain-containing protein [Croceibacterium soli]MXP41592.1 transglycosylase SLT domain-containing protein [Croceibacterium soli]